MTSPADTFDVVVLGAGTGGYTRGLPRRPARAPGRPRRRGQDRRHLSPSRLHPDQRRSSSRPRSPSASAHAADLGVVLPGSRSSTTRRWRGAATRSSSGCGPAFAHSSARTRSPGSRDAGGSTDPGESESSSRARTEPGCRRRAGARDRQRHPGHGQPSPLLPGLVPDGTWIVTSDDVLRMDTAPRERGRRGGGSGSAPSSPRCTTTSACRSPPRVPAADRPARGCRGERDASRRASPGAASGS